MSFYRLLESCCFHLGCGEPGTICEEMQDTLTLRSELRHSLCLERGITDPFIQLQALTIHHIARRCHLPLDECELAPHASRYPGDTRYTLYVEGLQPATFMHKLLPLISVFNRI